MSRCLTLLLVLGVSFAIELSAPQNYGRWLNCTYQQPYNNSNNFPRAFGCSKVISPIRAYGMQVMSGSNPDRYLEIYDNFPLSQSNLCSWEPLADYGFSMQQTCLQYFCSPNITDRSWIKQYTSAVAVKTELDNDGAYDLLDAMMHDYCYYCRDRPASDDFYTFHDMLLTNGSCPNFSWTLPEPKCRGFENGMPYGMGFQRRLNVRSPTICYCHQYDRFRFACDDFNGAISFFIEVVPYMIWILGLCVTFFVWVLVIIPIHVRKWMKLHGLSGREFVTELLDLRYISCCYMTVATPMMNVSDTFAINFDRILYERGIYQHQLDVTFGSTAVILMVTAHGIALINWVNLLHYASTLNKQVPLWRRIMTIVFLVVMTTAAAYALLCVSIPGRTTELAKGSVIFVFALAFVAMITYGPLFMIYGFRLLHMLRKSDKHIHPFNFRFMRFSVGLGVLAVVTVIEIILIAVSLFGDNAYNYGFSNIQALVALNMYAFILLLAYLLFKRENLPKFMHRKSTEKEVEHTPREIKEIEMKDIDSKDIKPGESLESPATTTSIVEETPISGVDENV